MIPDDSSISDGIPMLVRKLLLDLYFQKSLQRHSGGGRFYEQDRDPTKDTFSNLL